MIKGQIIGGEFGKLCIRQKSTSSIELGELLISENAGEKIVLQVYDLVYGSQISQANLELISGMRLEEDTDMAFFDKNIRSYCLAFLKPLLLLQDDKPVLCKKMPEFFSEVRQIKKEDMQFFSQSSDQLFVGNLRSGSSILDVPVSLPGRAVFQHHVLIPATTGRGKSNLVKVMLWNVLDKDYCGILVLDPHDEYYGRNSSGLINHPRNDNLVYYTPNTPPIGANSLRINLHLLRPGHFRGAVSLSDPQLQAMNAYFKKYGKDWVEAVILEKPLEVGFHEGTLAVLKRRILSLLNLSFDGQRLFSEGIFDLSAGESTINDIAAHLESGRVVVVDTSLFSGSVEILVGSLIASEVFDRYKRYKMQGILKEKPVISIVIEEAPRVIGKEVLESGPNIFSTIAREGRKFNVGLTAITQLPSMIPRQILANMNTKIVLGIEMKPERQAIIESASQDLSTDDRNIASLDKGEAIITSNFAKFAVPIKIPLFESIVKQSSNDQMQAKKEQSQQDFSGIKLV